ncbi:MAG: hypothetical protein IJZ04_05820 [Clostridia bacterium]|nr:hypothetical protein [Clostridia bacterium]
MATFEAELEALIKNMRSENEAFFSAPCDSVMLTDYKGDNGIWTDALQRALDENPTVIIPSGEYTLDGSIIIPSGRKIIANDGAIIRLAQGVKVLMMKNSNTVDGTHFPIVNHERNEGIYIQGGTWVDWCEHRMGYGQSGMYDEGRSAFGVSTMMLFECVDRLVLRDMVFRNCGGFAIQLGEIKNAVIEDIRFESCFADGVHINGNVENIYVGRISGEVGDDLVAFNMFDWQDSSINFGPCKNVICENLTLSKSSHYKALRIETGIYTFDDGSVVDCALNNAIFRKIRGIKTFKLYCQTPVYFPDSGPERAGVGSGDNILFEDIEIDLDSPIDPLDEYLTSHPVKGTIAGFELGTNIGNLYLRNIDITLHRDSYPLSYLACIGPKSVRFENGGEVFDPYLSSRVENLHLENIRINGDVPSDITPYIKEIVFDHLYDDIPSTGCGKIENIFYK